MLSSELQRLKRKWRTLQTPFKLGIFEKIAVKLELKLEAFFMNICIRNTFVPEFSFFKKILSFNSLKLGGI